MSRFGDYVVRHGLTTRARAAVGAGLAVLTVTNAAVVSARVVDGHAGDTAPPTCSALPTPVSAPEPGTPVARAVASAAPSVVSLAASSNAQSDSGSGVVVRSDGLILTNNHVVAAVAVNGGRITVTLHDGRTSPATIVGREPAHDIAVVRATAFDHLPPAQLGSSTALNVGDEVLAIGNALGESGTVTAGIVSALGRAACVTSSPAPNASDDIFGTLPSLPLKTNLDDLIQTDAPINPGNSGGALVDLAGRVVGITTLTLTAGGPGSDGIGFAIRIERAYADALRLIKAAAT